MTAPPPTIALPWGAAYLPPGRESVVIVSAADARALEVPLAEFRMIARWVAAQMEDHD